MNNQISQAMLRDAAHDNEIGLYRRYSEEEAATHLGITKPELAQLRSEGRIAFVEINGKVVGYFGHQLLTFLLGSATKVDLSAKPKPEDSLKPRTTAQKRAAQPNINPTAKLLSVQETAAFLGISRAKLYELLKEREFKTVKIGKRTLFKRSSIAEFIERHAQADRRR
ncbi:MAG: helix-turn-helix domain-containing protein [Magnetococcales bacterium]|nr:helix-turn-helix domain-containing protein [Magnetococcales bacterium]